MLMNVCFGLVSNFNILILIYQVNVMFTVNVNAIVVFKWNVSPFFFFFFLHEMFRIILRVAVAIGILKWCK